MHLGDKLLHLTLLQITRKIKIKAIVRGQVSRVGGGGVGCPPAAGCFLSARGPSRTCLIFIFVGRDRLRRHSSEVGKWGAFNTFSDLESQKLLFVSARAPGFEEHQDPERRGQREEIQ